MGCDIHLHTEVKIKGVWYHYGSPNVPRRYNIFAKMAGVRNRDDAIDPIAHPRGLPEDASVLTRFASEDYGESGHSHSWLSAEEIDELIEFIDVDLRLAGGHGPGWWDVDNFGYFFGNGWKTFWHYRNIPNTPHIPMGIEDVRFVFWFDN